MAHLFDRWRRDGVPGALRAWLPSPFHVSVAALRDEHPIRARVGATVAALVAAASAALAASPFLSASTAAMATTPRARDGAAVVGLVAAMFALPTGLVVYYAASSASKRYPQSARVGGAAAVASVALWSALDRVTDPGCLATVVVAALVGAALTLRPGTTTQRVFDRATLAGLALAGSAVLLAGAAMAVMALRGVEVSLAMGLSSLLGLATLAVASLMFVAQRADRAPWSTPETWITATLGEGNVLHFTNGAAPRQCPETLSQHRGPVVVIPLGELRRGAFRGDGAPDDGWTVPGTLDTVREGVASADVAASAMVLTAQMLSACLSLATLFSALRSLMA